MSILGTNNSELFHPTEDGANEATLPADLASHNGFSLVFKKGKLTFGLIAPFKGYPDTPIPDVGDLGKTAQLAEKAGFAALWIRDVPFYDPHFGDDGVPGGQDQQDCDRDRGDDCLVVVTDSHC